jgi:hypothetical protein
MLRVASGKDVLDYLVHDSRVISFSPDSKNVATIYNKFCVIFNVSSGKEILKLDHKHSYVTLHVFLLMVNILRRGVTFLTTMMPVTRVSFFMPSSLKKLQKKRSRPPSSQY